MSLHATLDGMAATLQRATSVPLSSSCLVNRAELMAMIEQARTELPVELEEASALLTEREVLLGDADQQARVVLGRAEREAAELVAAHSIASQARDRATEILDAARVEAARLLREADEYCDRRLGSFEDDLNRVLGQVRRGRDRLRERSDLGAPGSAAAELPTQSSGQSTGQSIDRTPAGHADQAPPSGGTVDLTAWEREIDLGATAHVQ